MHATSNKSVWSGVFFPANEPEEMSLIAEDPEDAPLDVEVVETNFEVEREDINENDSVVNEVTETPELIDETPATEESAETATSTEEQ